MANGYCQKHYMRLYRGGNLLVANLTPGWRGDQVTYSGLHRRLRTVRGSATNHPCVDCRTSTAVDWAYDHQDPDEKRSPAGLPYSTDLDRYRPLCKSCHVRFDTKTVTATAAELTQTAGVA